MGRKKRALEIIIARNGEPYREHIRRPHETMEAVIRRQLSMFAVEGNYYSNILLLWRAGLVKRVKDKSLPKGYMRFEATPRGILMYKLGLA